ncbi:MAG TPA: Coenzyme F420 hydrogenase/dehydrogenase, beta subunit C-terminal domain [Actinomycetes bacterium]|jgi:coenzyme F420 hydrogenase subunit beta|nr:Coenzyme F420 hydrogenase/dehydrogenase, beta subunit C-terminal domain [Actinomycetes bacterium]
MADSEKASWHDLYQQVVQTDLCAGCAACVMACPRNVLDYDHASYHPVNVESTTPAGDCAHGVRGCDICTRACPRFGAWELDGDQALHGRGRQSHEVFGIAQGIWLARSTHPEVLAAGQDGGLVSALLIWGLQSGRIEGALTSRRSQVRLWDAEPFLATTPAEVLEAAGSRYTYSANALAMRQAEQRGLKRLALVGTGCQAAMNGTLQARGVNKYARRIQLTIGLLCSKTFQYAGMRQVIEEHGVPLADVAKVDIKGKLLVWRRTTGERVDIPLKQLRAFTREACQLCPDFAASLADLSTGGLGQQDGWTLTIVRTQRGADWLQGAADAGAIEVRTGDEDPAAIALLAKLAAKSRTRAPAALAGSTATG